MKEDIHMKSESFITQALAAHVNEEVADGEVEVITSQAVIKIG